MSPNARVLIVLGIAAIVPRAVHAQVDRQRAQEYFEEARVLCEHDGGRLWGVSLCGPMVIADPATRTIATNQPAPEATRPAALGYANAALDWGGTRWTTLAWPIIPPDKDVRARLMLHELFHRVQPQLGLFLQESQNDHLDTLDGRYWIQLEWRALTAALQARGPERAAAVADALAFRAARFERFPGAADSERRLEINEGLAEYTGVAAWAAGRDDAAKAAAWRISTQAAGPTFVRTFAYASGAAYGVLLDAVAPGWTRALKPTDDLAALLAAAMKVQPSTNADAAAARHDGAALRRAEEQRDADAQKRIASLRRRFVEGAVLTLPAGGNASFRTAGITPIPSVGTVYPTYRATAEWGTLEGDLVLVSPDRSTLVVPAPTAPTEGQSTITGDGWTLSLAAGWTVRAGKRPGDLAVVRKD